jgi:alkylation response protein AidB-like acyl-CoA dehydrogenase
MILDDAQSAIYDAARRFAHEVLAPGAAGRDRSGDFPVALLRRMGTLGLMGVAVPERWGGAGGDRLALAAAVEAVSEGDAAIGTIMSTHNSLGCMPFLAYGSDEQRERFLVPLAKGELVGGFAVTESQAGSDASDIRVRAERRGDGYVLSGAKQLVTSGSDAGVILVFARTDADAGSRGITCFIVTPDLPGFRVGRVEDKVGIRASGTAELLFEDVELSADRVLGKPGEGLKIALTSLSSSRIGIAAQAVGIAQAALDTAVAYAREREAFGKPIGEHQAVGFRLADMATQIEAARLLTRQAAWLVDSGQPYQVKSSMAKLFAGRMAERVCSDALQIHGGYGYLRDLPLERYWRDARICQIYEGTNEIQHLIISRALLAG